MCFYGTRAYLFYLKAFTVSKEMEISAILFHLDTSLSRLNFSSIVL